MTKYIKTLRPAGNAIKLKKSTNTSLTLSGYSAYFYNSGTASLAAAIIAACKLRSDIDKPEIIIPAYGCPDLVSAAINANTVPVLVDLEPKSSCISIESLKNSISINTVAIVAVRFFGLNENFKELSHISNKNRLCLIEDSAQGFPSIDANKYWHGDIIVLSFGRGKPINLLNGGAVISRDPKLMKLLPSPSFSSESYKDKIKYNLKLLLYNQSIRPLAYGLITRLPGIKIGDTVYKPLHSISAMPNYSKYLLDSNIRAYATRRNIRHEYTKIFDDIDHLKLIDLTMQKKEKIDDRQPLLRYPILILEKSKRDLAHEKLKAFGASIMYKKPLNAIENINSLIKQNSENYPNAEFFSQNILTLPTHEDIDMHTIQTIGRIIKNII